MSRVRLHSRLPRIIIACDDFSSITKPRWYISENIPVRLRYLLTVRLMIIVYRMFVLFHMFYLASHDQRVEVKQRGVVEELPILTINNILQNLLYVFKFVSL